MKKVADLGIEGKCRGGEDRNTPSDLSTFPGAPPVRPWGTSIVTADFDGCCQAAS